MKLKVFSPRNCTNPEIDFYVPFLFPFWGKRERRNLAPESATRFDHWTSYGRQYYELVDDIRNCDFVVLPYEWRPGYAAALHLAKMARDSGKPLVMFFVSDSIEEIPIGDAVVFRTSLFTSKRRANEYGMPAWTEDFGSTYLNGKFVERHKSPSPVPTIGYTGYIDYRNAWEYLKYITRYVRHPRLSQIGPRVRGRCVRALRASGRVATNFILRNGCQTGTSSATMRRDFVDCILNSDYSLVCRGGGNFSYRLYEILTLGRIPMFVDTDCVLPYDNIIDWRRLCLWVDQGQLDQLANMVADFHAALSPEAFTRMQIEARRVYEEWISPSGFYRNLWRCLPESIHRKAEGMEA